MTRRSGKVVIFAAGSAVIGGCALTVDWDKLSAGARDGSISEAGSSDAPTDVTNDEDVASCTANLLTDPRNCGACGHDCLAGACAAGACQAYVLAGFQDELFDLACDDGAAYWLTSGIVTRKAFASTDPPTVLGSAAGSTLAIDARRVYVLEETPPTVRVLDKSIPGAASVFATADAGFASGLAVDDESLYVAGTGDNIDEITIVAKDGGATKSFSASNGNAMRAVSVAGESLYYFFFTSKVGRAPRTGGTAIVISDPLTASSTTNIAADSTGVAWISTEGNVAFYDPALGGNASVIIDGGIANSVGEDTARVYAALDPTPDGGTAEGNIVGALKDGGGIAIVAPGQSHPRMLRSCARANIWAADTSRIMVQIR